MKFWKTAIRRALVLIAIPPALALLSIIKALMKGIPRLGDNGIGDPTVLAAVIGESIITLAASLVFSLPGLILLIIALIKFRSNRAKYRALTA